MKQQTTVVTPSLGLVWLEVSIVFHLTGPYPLPTTILGVKVEKGGNVSRLSGPRGAVHCLQEGAPASQVCPLWIHGSVTAQLTAQCGPSCLGSAFLHPRFFLLSLAFSAHCFGVFLCCRILDSMLEVQEG